MWDGATRRGPFHENEDRWGIRGSWAWVVDGATNPMPAAGTAAQYAQALSDALDATVRRSPWVSPATVLEQALGDLRLGSLAGQSATVALADLRGDLLRWLVLGDCTVTWSSGGTLRSVTDDRLASVAVTERAAFTAAAPENREALRYGLVRAEQKWRNRRGGFWVATCEPRAARHALAGVSRGVDAVLLTTDGVRAPASITDLGSWAGLPDTALNGASTGADDATAVCAVAVPPYGSPPSAE